MSLRVTEEIADGRSGRERLPGAFVADPGEQPPAGASRQPADQADGVHTEAQVEVAQEHPLTPAERSSAGRPPPAGDREDRRREGGRPRGITRPGELLLDEGPNCVGGPVLHPLEHVLVLGGRVSVEGTPPSKVLRPESKAGHPVPEAEGAAPP